MATSLARQLQSLAAPQTDQFVHQGRKKASLLFDPSEAANYDFKDIYGIGLAGLQELQLLPCGDVFSRLEPILFSEVSQTVERSVRTEAVNRQLDESIEEFLREVSPYIMLSPAQKALEWLIVRFHINQYNIDAVMLAFLPYHETKLFVRMVQLLEFQFCKKWEWLVGVQKKGVILTKKDLIKYLIKENWLLTFICEEMIRRAGDRPIGMPPVKSGVDVYCKFFAATVLALLHQVKDISNPLIAGLLPCMSKCLQSEAADYRLTAYAIIASLCQKIKLKDETNKAIGLAIGEAISKHQDENGMKALAVVLTAHERDAVSEKVFQLFGSKDFFNLAVTCINKFKLMDFFWIVFRTSVDMLFQPKNPSAENLVDFIGLFGKKTELPDESKAKIVRHIVKKTLELKSDLTAVDLSLGRCLAKMRDFDPVTWSTLLHEQGSANDHLLERLDLTFFQEADAISLTSTTPTTSLFLRLNHPNIALRMAAAKELTTAWPSEAVSVEFLTDMMRDRLEDTDSGVVEVLLEDPVRLGKIVPGEMLRGWMARLLCRLDGKEKDKREKWDKVEAEAVAVLAQVGQMEDFLPFFLGAVFRRNLRIAECRVTAELFPKCLARLKEKAPLSKILSDATDDFEARSGSSLVPCIQSLLALLDQPTFPLNTALCSISLLVEVISRTHHFFLSSDAARILDCVDKFLQRVTVSDRVITEEHLEQSFSHIKRGKLSGAVVLGWCTLLWANFQFDHVKTELQSLCRAAKFVLVDCAAAKDKLFKQALVTIFVVSVLKDVTVLASLLTAVMERPDSKAFFCRNVLLMCGEALLVMKAEEIRDDVVGDLLGVAVPAMRHQDLRMRQGGLKLLEHLKGRYRFQTSVEVLDLLKTILEGRDRIEQDELATAQVLGDMFLNSNYTEATKRFWLNLLLQPVRGQGEIIQLNMLIALRLVRPFAVFMALLPKIEGLIADYGKTKSVFDIRSLNECLERLAPHAAGVRFPLTPEAEGPVVKVMLDALNLPCRFNVEAPAEVVLRQMFFLGPAHLGQELYGRILQSILKIYVEKSNPTCQVAFRKYLKHVRIPGSLIVNQLNEEDRPPGKRHSSHGLDRLNSTFRQSKTFWLRVCAVLEVIQSKKKISDVNVVLKELFDLAKETVVVLKQTKDDLLEPIEQARRLIFGTINFHCKRAQTAAAGGDSQDSSPVDSSSLDVSAVVDCIDSSSDSLTSLTAFTLLSTLATMIPTNVMQNCMTIFTLTSNTKLLQKDDEYSVEVVGRIIDVIVPVMLQAKPTGQHNTVREVLELFVDALPHMPVSRRQFLFQRVLKVAAGPENMWILVVLLVNVYVSKGLSVEDEDLIRRRSYPVLCEFLEQLFESLSLEEQVRNLKQATEYILATNTNTKSLTQAGAAVKKRRAIIGTFEKPLINVNFSPEDRVKLTAVMVTFIGYQIPSHAFRTAYDASRTGTTDISALDSGLEQLLVGLLDIQSQARAEIRTTKPGGEGPAWGALLKRTSVAVTEILGQMSWGSFVTVMMGILRDLPPAMMKTALEELGGTLSLRGGIGKAEVGCLVPLIDVLVGILTKETELTADAAGVQRGCLFCLKQLAAILGTHAADKWSIIMSSARIFLTSPDLLISCEAINCLISVIATVKTAFLPYLPDYLPPLLKQVRHNLTANAQDTVALLTGMEALEVVVTVLTAFLSRNLPDILGLVALCAGMTVKVTVKEVFGGRLVKIRGVLCSEVPFRVMFSAFKEAYGKSKSTEVFNIFNDSLKKAKTGDILSMQREIVDFLFTVFDTRENLPAALDTLSLVALRMPESSFKGLFGKLHQWAIQDGIQRTKLWTFYQIVDRLTDTLKHMFVIYAAQVVGHSVSTMNAFHVDKAKSSNDEDKALETDVLTTTFDVLTKFFKYDASGYFDADQCDILNQPLIDQLDNYRDPLTYQRLTDHLIPAITGFTVCLNDDSLWKPLHYQVLLKTRHDQAAVRVAALQTISALVEAIGDAYSNLLPEAVTFLVELSAEDDELVEAQCAKTKALIERVLGDSTIWKNEID